MKIIRRIISQLSKRIQPKMMVSLYISCLATAFLLSSLWNGRGIICYFLFAIGLGLSIFIDKRIDNWRDGYVKEGIRKTKLEDYIDLREFGNQSQDEEEYDPTENNRKWHVSQYLIMYLCFFVALYAGIWASKRAEPELFKPLQRIEGKIDCIHNAIVEGAIGRKTSFVKGPGNDTTEIRSQRFESKCVEIVSEGMLDSLNKP